MKRNVFTEEEIEQLRKNPYTYEVNRRTISFTAEFKEAFLQLFEDGMTAKQAVEELGYSAEMLKGPRINSLKKGILSQIARSGKPHSGRYLGAKSMDTEHKTEAPPDEMTHMKIKIRHLEQQIEFLKKTLLIQTKNG